MDKATQNPSVWQRLGEHYLMLRLRLALGAADGKQALQMLERLTPPGKSAGFQALLLEEAGRWGRHLEAGGVIATESWPGLLWKECKWALPLAAAFALGAAMASFVARPMSSGQSEEPRQPSAPEVAIRSPESGVPLQLKGGGHVQVLVADTLRTDGDGSVQLHTVPAAEQENEWRDIADFEGDQKVLGMSLQLWTYNAGGDLKRFYLWPKGVPESGSWISENLASLLASQMNDHVGAPLEEAPRDTGTITLAQGESLREYPARWSEKSYLAENSCELPLSGSVQVTGEDLWLGVAYHDGNGQYYEGWLTRNIDWADCRFHQDLEVKSTRALRREPNGTEIRPAQKDKDVLYLTGTARASGDYVWLQVLAICADGERCECWVAGCENGTG